MSHGGMNTLVSRRRMLALGGGAAGGLVSAARLSAVADASTTAVRAQAGKLPAKRIQEIVQAQGTVTSGVLSIDVTRSDIGEVSGPLGVTFTPSFQIDGTLTFQPLGDRLAFFNGDLPLKPDEANRFIDALVAHGLTFQAFHQHYIEMNPQVWFIHWRGMGDPIKLARAVHDVLKATSTPLPQTMPSNPKSPLDAKRLGKILHGQAQVGEEGVVTVNVSRRGKIVIDGVKVSPETNISTNIQFKPLASTGPAAAVGPDFSMTAREIQSVVRVMRKQDWFVGCLYNQETGESPQLYFAHMLKTGNAYALAHEIRRGLNRTNAD
jgi:uncharacterized protein DUF1259